MKKSFCTLAVLCLFPSYAGAAEVIGNWVYGENTDQITGQKGAVAGINTDDMTATIGLKCDETVEGNPVTFILRVPNSVVLPERPLVTIKVDGRAPMETYWYRAVRDGAVMFPGSEVRKWAREIGFGNELLVRVRDVDNQTADFRFFVSRPEQIFRKVYTTCGANSDHLKPPR